VVAVNEKLPGTLLAAARYFDAEKSAAYIASIKWPGGPCCPKCGSVNVGEIKSRARFQCREKQCRKQFSLITGTIMESSHLRLEQWVLAVWMIVNCRNGVSSCEIARHVGCKQQSAWHLLHRVRHVLQQDHSEPMRGVVEADETYIGGLLEYMHADKRREKRKSGYGKTAVLGMLNKTTGEVRAHPITHRDDTWVRPSIEKNVAPGSELHTDCGTAFRSWTLPRYNHHTVNHSAGQYVKRVQGERGITKVTTNGLEGFFNCLRRGLKGTYIRPTAEHLAAYVDEQVWRFNVRTLTEWERFDKAMRLIVGKRLTYSELTDGAVR
jgi:transposase-like protein